MQIKSFRHTLDAHQRQHLNVVIEDERLPAALQPTPIAPHGTVHAVPHMCIWDRITWDDPAGGGEQEIVLRQVLGANAFREAIERVSKAFCLDTYADTPDSLLATFLDKGLHAFAEAMHERNEWAGHEPTMPAPPAEGEAP
jgi:hypothetical protein